MTSMFEGKIGGQNDTRYGEARGLEHDFGSAGVKPVEGGPTINPDGMIDAPELLRGSKQPESVSKFDFDAEMVRLDDLNTEYENVKVASDAKQGENVDPILKKAFRGEVKMRHADYVNAIESVIGKMEVAVMKMSDTDYEKSVSEVRLEELKNRLVELRAEEVGNAGIHMREAA